MRGVINNMKVTLKGKPVELAGVQPKVGEKAPDFSLVNLNKTIIQLSDLSDKPVIISVVPNINTSICQLQTKRFNQEAAEIDGVHFLTISNNTKEEQESWCAAEGVEMQMLHDTELKFGKLYGLFMPEVELLARAIFVVDKDMTIVYEELVPEIATEPDYEKALVAAKELI